MDSAGERRVAVIIEDDADIRFLLETVLSQAGFETIPTGNGLEGIAAVRANNPLVTTLDVNMPGIDGFETARRIRGFSSTYLVLLTARDEEIDLLHGLDSGADDYITKPFRPRELRARIEAMLRRPRVQTQVALHPPPADTGPVAQPNLAPTIVAATPEADPDTWLAHNGLRINVEARIALLNDVEIDLTRSEFDIMVGLLESGRRVRTKHELALILREPYVRHDYVNESDKRAVEVHVANLRRKLNDDARAPRFLETVRGVGYRLSAANG